jgi:ribose-phosphate pyrophosphokinase
VVITDSIPASPDRSLDRIKILTVAELFADAIKRIHFDESVSKLFD